MQRGRIVANPPGGHSRNNMAAIPIWHPPPGAQTGISCSVVAAFFSPSFFYSVSLTVILAKTASELDFTSGFLSSFSTGLLLLKLARAGFCWIQIRILTGAYSIGSQTILEDKNLRLYHGTSLFSLRGNALRNNLQQTEQWNST